MNRIIRGPIAIEANPFQSEDKTALPWSSKRDAVL